MSIDTKKLDEYAKQAKEIYGATPQYQEFREKTRSKTKGEMQAQGEEIMSIVAEFGKLKALPANDPAVQQQVKKLQDFITENYYTCSKMILAQLGLMYAAGGEFTANINAAGGEGAAEFANEAIQIYCNE